jgi:hypothetical protein
LAYHSNFIKCFNLKFSFLFFSGFSKEMAVEFYHKGFKTVNAMLHKEEGRPLFALEAKHSYGLKLDDSHL